MDHVRMDKLFWLLHAAELMMQIQLCEIEQSPRLAGQRNALVLPTGFHLRCRA